MGKARIATCHMDAPQRSPLQQKSHCKRMNFKRPQTEDSYSLAHGQGIKVRDAALSLVRIASEHLSAMCFDCSYAASPCTSIGELREAPLFCF